MRLADQICTKRKNKSIPTFLKKTYQILQDQSNQNIVRWAPNGIGFIVINQQLFCKNILSKYFKHSNYSSFVRQLNMYNFHKIRESGTQNYFRHQLFIRNDKNMLAQIKRKPEKKRRKNQEQSDYQSLLRQIDSQKQQQKKQIINTTINNIVKKSLKIPRRYNLMSYQVNQYNHQNVEHTGCKKSNQQNTRDAFFSEHDNENDNDQNENLKQQVVGSQNIFSIQAEDDRISIDGGMNINNREMICTKQLIYASNNNIIPIGYGAGISYQSLNLQQ